MVKVLLIILKALKSHFHKSFPTKPDVGGRKRRITDGGKYFFVF